MCVCLCEHVFNNYLYIPPEEENAILSAG